ncbi:MAG: hypothetical protein Q9204_003475 [Flavoplaca sp. TL-2023a]
MSTPYLPSYKHLTTHIIPGPASLSYFIPFLLLPTALCIPPSLLSKTQVASLFFPAIVACVVHAWVWMGGVDVVSVNVVCWGFVLLVCYDPRKGFGRLRRVGGEGGGAVKGEDEKGDGKNSEAEDGEITHVKEEEEKGDWNERNEVLFVEEGYPKTLRERIPWILALLPSLRLSNWKTGYLAHDRLQPITPLSPKPYLTHAVVLLIQSYLILDVTSYFTAYDPYFHISDTSISSPLPPLPFSPTTTNSHSKTATAASFYLQFLWNIIPPRLLRASILALQPYALITQGGSLPTIPIVLLSSLNLWPEEWSPHTWPLFFGPFSSVYERGLRGVWGTWWHQTNRYLASPGRWVADKWGWKGYGKYAFEVMSAFGLSGGMHMGLVPPFPLGTEVSALEMRMCVAGFFWVQVLGIGGEVLVVEGFGRVFDVLRRFFSRWKGTGFGRVWARVGRMGMRVRRIVTLIDSSGNITSKWVPEPNGRGTFTLLSSCLVTISLCVYSAIHLNLPQHGKLWDQWRRKLLWLVVGLIAPELVAYVAWQQRSEANRLLRGIQSGLWQDPLAKSRGPDARSPRSIKEYIQRLASVFVKSAKNNNDPTTSLNADSHPRSQLSVVHGFYALMGGYAFSIESADGATLPSPHTRAALTPAGIMFCLRHEPKILPYVSPEQIKDKSKADGLKKTLVCAQATWFCVQCIARLAKSLPLSLLELNTVAHALCTLVIYLLWWHKPLDVEEPTLITDPKLAPMLAYMWMTSRIAAAEYVGYDIGGRLRDEFDCIWPFENPVVGDLIFKARTSNVSDPATFAPIELPPKADSVAPNPSRQVSRPSSEVFKPFSTAGLIHRGASLPTYGRYDYNFRRRQHSLPLTILRLRIHFTNQLLSALRLPKCHCPPRQPPDLFTRNTAIDHLTPSATLRWKLAHTAIGKYNLESDLRKRHATPVKGTLLSSRLALRSREITFRIDKLPLATSVSISGLLYGGLHLVAWNADFASHAELLLWRISAVFVACNGILMGIVGLLLSSEKARRVSQETSLGMPNPSARPRKRKSRVVYNKLLTAALFLSTLFLPLLWFSYVLARVYLVVEAFRNLAYLPAGAFETPEWPNYFPHIT